MLLITSKKHTPGTRHRLIYKNIKLLKYNKNNFSKNKNKQIRSLNKKKTLRRRIYLKNFFYLKKFSYGQSMFSTIFINYIQINYKRIDYGLYTNIYGQKFYNFSLLFSHPGLKSYCNKLGNINKINFFGSKLIPLLWIPINSVICNIYNLKNTNQTYAKSFGSQAFRQKIIKKSKLIVVKLPSKKLKFFSNLTYSCFGSLSGISKNKLVEGAWGYSLKKFKKINVRGVAKNPVDHPNGGRTKAKQPELSPWGWVSKHNK